MIGKPLLLLLVVGYTICHNINPYNTCIHTISKKKKKCVLFNSEVRDCLDEEAEEFHDAQQEEPQD